MTKVRIEKRKRKPVTSYPWCHNLPQYKSALTDAGWNPEQDYITQVEEKAERDRITQ